MLNYETCCDAGYDDVDNCSLLYTETILINISPARVRSAFTPCIVARFCLSAAHTREQLDECLAAVEAVVDEVGLRYSRRH